jgi:hypothetical protein
LETARVLENIFRDIASAFAELAQLEISQMTHPFLIGM